MTQGTKDSKLKMHSPDLTQDNIGKLAEIFPNCITESRDEKGQLKQAIDFDQLRQELSDHVVEGPQERYHLNWPGKKEALLSANAPVAKTLRPCREASVDFETTKNLFIEGDNLDALKLLQETYLNKVKMIYIDPPYNTGNDSIYKDDYSEDSEKYLQKSLQKDENKLSLIINHESNGRFHSDWLSMIYPRLKIAKNLLREDGVIFISIGDNELHNLKKVCDEVFGEVNFIVTFSRMMKSGGAKGRFYTPNIDYILTYAKNINSTPYFRIPLTKDQIDRFYNKIQESGPKKGKLYGEERLYKASLDPRPNQRYYIECPDGSYVIPPGVNFPKNVSEGEQVKPTSEDGVWKWVYSTYKEELDKGNIVFKKTTRSALVDEKGAKNQWNIYNKLWLDEQQRKGSVPSNFIGDFENRQSSAELKELGIPFDFAKPTKLIKHLIGLANLQQNEIVLDFFAGSATTAQAVMQINLERNHNIRYIMVQIDEKIDESLSAYAVGFKTIAEVGKERINRVIKKINDSNDNFKKVDTGYRLLKIGSSNMKEAYYTSDKVTQKDLFGLVDNIKKERTAEDLLFQVLLDWGVDLTLPIQQETILSKKVYFVDQDALAACFEPNLDEEFIKKLAERKPLRAVFRDSGFGSDSTKINVDQIFKLISPNTDVKTI